MFCHLATGMLVHSLLALHIELYKNLLLGLLRFGTLFIFVFSLKSNTIVIKVVVV
jgi:hypothetical protein